MRRNNNPVPNHSDSSASSGQGSGFAGNVRTDPRGYASFPGNQSPPNPLIPKMNTKFHPSQAKQHISPQQMAPMSGPALPVGTRPLFMPVADIHPTGDNQRGYHPGSLGLPLTDQSARNPQAPLGHPPYRHPPSSSGNASHSVPMSETNRNPGETARLLTQLHLVSPNNNMLPNAAGALSMYPPQQQHQGQGAGTSAGLFCPPYHPSPSSYSNSNQGMGQPAILSNHATPNFKSPMVSPSHAAPHAHQLSRHPSQESPTLVAESSNVDMQTPLMVCTDCGVGFSGHHRKRNWSRHREKHQGGNPISCEDCDSTFGRSDALLKHRRQKHPERGIAGPVPRPRNQRASEIASGVHGTATTSSSPASGVVNHDWNPDNGNALGNFPINNLNSLEDFFPEYNDSLSMGNDSRS